MAIVSPLPEPDRGGFLSNLTRAAGDVWSNLKRTIQTPFGNETQNTVKIDFNKPSQVVKTIPSPTLKPLVKKTSSVKPQVLSAQTVTQPPVIPTGTLGRNPSTMKVPIQPIVQRAIENAASAYGLPVSLLYDIAFGESSLNPFPPEVTDQYGNIHRGLFQFDQPTWNTASRYAGMPGSSLRMPQADFTDPEAAALVAAYLISHGQLGRWEASRPTWGQYYTDEELAPYFSQLGR